MFLSRREGNDEGMVTEKIGCGNPACQCMVTSDMSGEAYCGAHCSDVEQGEEEALCACGHPPCDTP
jgi:hypothetical protein